MSKRLTAVNPTPAPTGAAGRKQLALAASLALFLLASAGVVLWARSLSPSQGNPPSASNLTLLSSRPPAPDFSVVTTEGSSYRLSEQRGQVQVLFFTAPG